MRLKGNKTHFFHFVKGLSIAQIKVIYHEVSDITIETKRGKLK